MTKTIGNYKLLKRIGRGSFATVWKGVELENQHAVAIKILTRSTFQENAQFHQEVSVLKQIQHVNVVKLIDLKRTPSSYFLILEYCSGGDLAAFLTEHKLLLEFIAQRFLRQILYALHELSKHHLIHRDLKPQNILLTENSTNAIVKVADFGLARDLPSTDMAATMCGSPLYMAPEVLRNDKYGPKADIWAVGAILFECIFGGTPYTGNTPCELLKNIETQDLKFPGPVSVHCGSFLRQTLTRECQTRIAPPDFFVHPFVAEGPGSPKEGDFQEEVPPLELPLEAHSFSELQTDIQCQPYERDLSDSQDSELFSPSNDDDEFVLISQEVRSASPGTSPIKNPMLGRSREFLNADTCNWLQESMRLASKLFKLGKKEARVMHVSHLALIFLFVESSKIFRRILPFFEAGTPLHDRTSDILRIQEFLAGNLRYAKNAQRALETTRFEADQSEAAATKQAELLIFRHLVSLIRQASVFSSRSRLSDASCCLEEARLFISFSRNLGDTDHPVLVRFDQEVRDLLVVIKT